MINGIKGNSNKQLNEVRKSISDLDKTIAIWMRSTAMILRF
jgi:hypothetical protein